MAIENRLKPRGLDLAPFQTQGDAVENEEFVLDPAEPALHPVKPALDPVKPPADLAMKPV